MLRFLVVTLMALISLCVMSTDVVAKQPVKHVCSVQVPDMEVRIVGRRGDLVEIHDKKSGRFYPAYEETQSQMGGRDDQLNCGDVLSSRNIIVVRTGFNNDLIQIYGITPKRELLQYLWLPHDGELTIRVDPDRVRLLLGHNRDRRHTVCFPGAKHFEESRVSGSEATNGSYPRCNHKLTNYSRRSYTGVSRAVSANASTSNQPGLMIADCGCRFDNGSIHAFFLKRPIGHHLIMPGQKTSVFTFGRGCSSLMCTGGAKISNGDLSMTINTVERQNGNIFDFILRGN